MHLGQSFDDVRQGITDGGHRHAVSRKQLLGGRGQPSQGRMVVDRLGTEGEAVLGVDLVDEIDTEDRRQPLLRHG